MSKLYLTASSDMSKTNRTARGTRYVSCALQSWNGSIGVSLFDNGCVEITTASGSDNAPDRVVIRTTLDKLLSKKAV